MYFFPLFSCLLATSRSIESSDYPLFSLSHSLYLLSHSVIHSIFSLISVIHHYLLCHSVIHATFSLSLSSQTDIVRFDGFEATIKFLQQAGTALAFSDMSSLLRVIHTSYICACIAHTYVYVYMHIYIYIYCMKGESL